MGILDTAIAAGRLDVAAHILVLAAAQTLRNGGNPNDKKAYQACCQSAPAIPKAEN